MAAHSNILAWRLPWTEEPGGLRSSRIWQPTPIFLSGDSHGRKSLEGYCPKGCKESDTTERLSAHTQGLRQHKIRALLPIGVCKSLHFFCVQVAGAGIISSCLLL